MHGTSTSSSPLLKKKVLEQVYAQLERERAIQGKIQRMLNDACENLLKLDPNFEAPQFDLEDDGDQ